MELPLVRVDPARAAPGAGEGERRWLAQLAGPYQRRADAVTRRAVAWLDGLGERRAFLWIHYFDPHQPYDAPAPWTTAYDPGYRGEADGDVYRFADLARRRGWGALRDAPPAERAHMVARYDGEISFMDQEIGTLLGALERAGRLERALVVVVADHGEAFGEHVQIFEHNLEVFDPAVRVPLVVRRPDGVGRGARVPGLVRTLDVAPTILEWAGLEVGAGVEGVSLLDLTRDPRAAAPGEVLLEARRERQVRPAPHSFLALRSERHKLLRRLDPNDRVRSEVFYDLELDPREQAPRPAAEVGEAGALAARLDALRAGLERPREALPVRPLDEITSEALKALGYIER
jgi:arylsulfatase A-like enzyme